ncbi:ATP-binding cassette domain-containing protein [Alkalibaculum sp. M08DMB]|uniref:ATP-binding cassette domain-containing protein n=1 Tax=Alkalibaculum sporogenes TaxID=2655001 RepID=A0A6A7K865_9FIRM|nr:ABC transporter ATP-binding protein [Alkalibaculum sporogenes]MPW25562.1 ATP-binding cassette domain-containing protein [Alkalibaculum sporogenes]
MDSTITNKKGRTRSIGFIKLLKYLKSYRKGLGLAVTSGVLHHVFAISTSVVCAYIVGLIARDNLSGNGAAILMILGVLVVLRTLMYYGEMWFAHEVAYRILADFRIALYNAVERVSPGILLNMRSGQLASTLMSDVEVLEWFFAHTFGNMIVASIVTTIVLCFLAALNIYLAIIILFLIIIILSIPLLLQKKADEQGRDVRDKLSDANAEAVEGIQGLREILALNYKKGFMKKMYNSIDKLSNSQITYGKRLGLEGSLLHIAVGLAMISILTMSAFLVYEGVLAFEWFTVAVILGGYSFGPIMEISSMARNFGIILASSNRVFEVLESKSLVEYKETSTIKGKFKSDILFDNVSFSYKEDNNNAVDAVSFQVYEGETVALVGHSGAGKSTCINLLLRFWDVKTGAIKIGSHDIRDMTQEELRSMTCAVLQDVYLFHTTIGENIRLGKPEATDEEVENAAKLAFAHEFISGFPKGYDTKTGERGVQLSGGQKQRISIARALLKDTPILIMDEAVSNLDSENEQAIQQALERLRRGRTTLIIAHRLSTILSADRLVVMKNGKVVETGTHEDLLKEGKYYKELIASQYSLPTDVKEI